MENIDENSSICSREIHLQKLTMARKIIIYRLFHPYLLASYIGIHPNRTAAAWELHEAGKL